MSELNGVLFWILIWVIFEVSITLSLFDALKLFDSLLLTCDLTVLHLPSWEMYKTFLNCFLLDDVNTIYIYFTFVNSSSVQSKFSSTIIRPEISWALSVNSSCENIVLDSIVFKNNWQIIYHCTNVNSLK